MDKITKDQETQKSSEQQPAKKPRTSSSGHRKNTGSSGRNVERKIKSLEDRLRNRDEQIKNLKKQLAEKTAIDTERLLSLVGEVIFYIENHRETMGKVRELRDVYKMVHKFFSDNGLKIFGRKGEKYEPSKHEALLLLNDEDIQPGKITEVKSPGIRKGRKIIQKAKVLVSKQRS